MERPSEQAGDPDAPSARGRTLVRVLTIGMWGMLLAGAVLEGPLRFGLWAAACGVGGARNLWMARRTRRWIYWVMATVFFAAAAFVVVEGFALGCEAERASANESPAAQGAEVPAPRAGAELVGRPAPSWDGLTWLDGEERSLEQLRGRVVLVRFWTSTCPYCEASAPAFAELHEDFGDRGLVVVGLHHEKPRGRPVDRAALERKVERFGWTFPVATDGAWSVLERYWLDTGDRRATSASFLIDREGRIRWVHPGPELHPDGPEDHAQCRHDYRDLRQAVRALL